MHRVMVDPAQAVEPFGAQKIDRTASDRRANDVDPERRALDFRDRALLRLRSLLAGRPRLELFHDRRQVR
jgi:hypothetical protein